MLLQQQGSRVEVARPQMFNGKMEEVSAFINVACLYIRMKMTEEAATTQVAWVLSYVQGGVAEAWKDNLLDELAKGESEVESVKQLFTKIRNDFGETSEEERKIEQLRTIEQGGRTYNEYVQEFKKVARGSGYEERPLIEEFKRGLNGAIRRKLAKAEESPSTIGEWQERAVRLDRNQRQSRGCWRRMQRAQREMRSQGEDRMEEKGNRSCRGGGIVEEEIRSTEGDTSRVHGETQTQWMLIEEQEGIGNVITAGSLATWPGIVGIGIKQE